MELFNNNNTKATIIPEPETIQGLILNVVDDYNLVFHLQGAELFLTGIKKMLLEAKK